MTAPVDQVAEKKKLKVETGRAMMQRNWPNLRELVISFGLHANVS